MKTQQQGDDYIDNEDYDDDDDLDDEDYEDDDEFDDDDDETPPQSNLIFGVPKTTFIIIVAILFIAIIAIVVITQSKPKEDEVSTDDEVSTMTYEEFLAQQEATEAEVTVEETPTEEVDEATLADIVNYDRDAKELSKYGYTGEEITMAEKYGISKSSMIADAEQRQELSAKDRIQELSDTGSPEYKRLMDYTYLGQRQNGTPVDQSKVENPVAYDTQMTINSDYVKCPVNGRQLYLKCKIYKDVYVWYSPRPQRFAELPTAGNIVLDVTIAHYGNYVYITRIEEHDSNVKTNLDTIEADDLNISVQEGQESYHTDD